MITKEHPRLGVQVRSDGAVLVKNTGRSKGMHWTFGSDCHGYLQVSINGKNYLVHSIVAEAFLGERPNGMEIDHIDRNRTNNDVKNLRYVSRIENRNNRDDVDRIMCVIGCHQREDKIAYNKYYVTTDRGKLAKTRASHKYNKTHSALKFSDGKRHMIDRTIAAKLVNIPVEKRIWGEG